jgi:hypothetical protein
VQSTRLTWRGAFVVNIPLDDGAPMIELSGEAGQRRRWTLALSLGCTIPKRIRRVAAD